MLRAGQYGKFQLQLKKWPQDLLGTPFINFLLELKTKKQKSDVLSFHDCVNEIRPTTIPWSQYSMVLPPSPTQTLVGTRVNINIPILITRDPLFSPRHPHTFIIVFVHFLPPPSDARTQPIFRYPLPFSPFSPLSCLLRHSTFQLTIYFLLGCIFSYLKPQISQFNLLFLQWSFNIIAS